MEKIIRVKALLWNTQNEILLVRRTKTAPRRPLQWDLPGGGVDIDDQSYQMTCLREVREETGMTVTNNRLVLAYAETILGGSEKRRVDVSWLYFAGIVSSTDVTLSYEHDEFTWVPLDRARELITYDVQLRALDHVARVQE